MKKATNILLGLFLLFTGFSFSQGHWCGTDQHTQRLMIEKGISALDMHERIMRIVEHQPSMSRVGPYTIPVVFHIIHDNGIGNISQVQVQDAIEALNEDYNRMNADSINWRNTVDAPFQPQVADIQMVFKLAKLDPNSQCTNGIVRVNAQHLTYNASDDVKSSANGGSDPWDVNNYLNIWVVNSIETDGQGTTLGYATLPYFGMSSSSGIVMRHDAVGRLGVGTANSDGRTLTHEAGHFFGLLHTFQGDFWGGTTGCHSTDCNDNGDYVCDTPPTHEATWTCNLNLNTCSDIPVNSSYGIDANDMIENYMSYDACTNMFTLGQRNRMWTVMNSAAYPAYNNLGSATNATATGINLPDVLCTADFASDARIVCAGATINFTDESFNYVTGRTWSFPGGTPSSTTDSAVSVVYSTPGVYDVSLSVTDGVSNIDTLRAGYIIVLDNPGNKDTLMDNFENYSVFPDYDNWVVQTGYAQTFEITNSASVSGSNSLTLPIHGFSGIRTDELVSGVYDFSNAPIDSNFYLSFKYAYKNRTSNTSNGTNHVKVFISQDCGENWLARMNIVGNNFGSGVDGSAFVPGSSDWITEELTLPVSQVQYSDFRFKFVVGTEDANNFYLEDVNVYIASQSHLGLQNNYSLRDFNVYPNPTTSSINIDFNTKASEIITVDLRDLSGRKIKTLLNNSKVEAGESRTFDLEGISQGIYLMKIQIGEVELVKKIILN